MPNLGAPVQSRPGFMIRNYIQLWSSYVWGCARNCGKPSISLSWKGGTVAIFGPLGFLRIYVTVEDDYSKPSDL